MGNFTVFSWQGTNTSDFLYKQLDLFLHNPTSLGSLKLSKTIASKEDQLYTKSDQLAWVIVHCNLGYYRSQFGSISSAIHYYEKAWQLFYEKKLSDYDIIENCLQPLGNLYIKIGDLPKAENTIINYLYLAEQSQNEPKVISAIINLSIAYNNQSNYTKAFAILEKGLRIDPNNINILTNLATNYLETGDLEQSQEKANNVLQIDPNQINAYKILAAIALEKKQLHTAEKYILKARSQLLKNKSTTARSFAKWNLAYIDILLSKLEYEEVQKSLNDIYASLLPGYSEKNELPTEENLIADKVLLKSLDIQAYVYQQTHKPYKAIKAFNLAFSVNEKLNILYPLQETKILQHSQNRNRTENYIELLFSLYHSEKNKTFIEHAFQASEYSKAPIVTEALLSKEILSQYKNDSLIRTKNKIDSELSFYETLIIKEKIKGSSANIGQIQKWVKVHASKSIDLKKTTEALQDKYPVLIHPKKTISLEELQKKLTKDKATLIEYFYGNRNIYQFEIRSDFFNIKKIENTDDFKVTIKEHIGFYDSPSNISNDIPRYIKNAIKTFELLKIPIHSKNLLIIPDGLLYFIPFEALLIEHINGISFNKMPFLLKSIETSYEISAGKYLRTSEARLNKNTVLGVFPIFENTDLELPHSSIENTKIQKHFDGEFIEKEQATYDTFVQKSNNKKHGIIHLSTHAQSGSFSKPASIKFRNQDILVNQLYALNLNADLIVLSACETGVGKLIKGEGPISISRGFQYAGVKNVLFSLWKVNDKTTSVVMEKFYQNLKKSNAKGYSLHQAKLDYLKAEDISNIQKSPYYWAAFVYYGGIEQLDSLNYVWYYMGIVLFILIALLLRKFLQQKK
ncbi:CHAT domain-containing protein [Aquimarina gracilis]|uniref:CHAT domain-containing protein n=2 Tax=Aquimarina gracilis TaxID=874422 RepID=A0ABU5ZQK7_9FLAO|nr:CHAT domain-containing protein [Aquimarina gracilis]MEB3344209.1 CHAT domain-containing protein [Aquimarina gracilis]